MNKTTIILILILLTIVPFISAQLEVSPMALDKTVYTDIDYDYNITFQNNNTYDIYYIQFNDVDDITFPEPFNLSINEVITKQINVKTTEGFDRNLVSKIFYYEKSNISQEVKNHQVNISNDFSPNDFNVIEGSTITWFNKDTITHSVTSNAPVIDVDILPNQQYSYTFNSPQDFEYYDKYMNWDGMIHIKDAFEEGYVHNPDTDQDLTIHLKSILVETIIDPTLYDTNLTVENNDETEGVIIIKNTGNKTAKNISLKGEQWLVFNKANFEIKKGETSYVTFKVHPLIENLNLTGRDYTLNIDITGTNFLAKSLSLNIYVPESDDPITDQDLYDKWHEKRLFCEENPTSMDCMTDPIEVIVNNTIYKSPPVPYNYTQEDMANIHKNYYLLRDDINNGDNFIKTQNVQIINNTNTIIANQNIIIANQEEIIESNRTLTNAIWVCIILLIVSIVTISVVFLIKSKIIKGKNYDQHY